MVENGQYFERVWQTQMDVNYFKILYKLWTEPQKLKRKLGEDEKIIVYFKNTVLKCTQFALILTKVCCLHK